MADNTTIEWTDATVNLWWGCAKVSEACRHCYAAEIDRRFNGGANWRGERLDRRESGRKLALRLNRKAEREGRRYRVFALSMGDWLDPAVPVEWLADLLALIQQTPRLDWLLLTKRPELFDERLRAASLSPEPYGSMDAEGWGRWMAGMWRFGHVPANVWLGVTAENQKEANRRIPALLDTPARVRFVSYEPALGPVSLDLGGRSFGPDGLFSDRFGVKGRIHWVIVGGETGRAARPMHPDWARSMRDQCRKAEVAFFMKQMGGSRKPFPVIPEDLFIREFPEAEGDRAGI